MSYVERRINRNSLVKEITFDFDNNDTRVENDRVFLKIKECPIPIEPGFKVTFTKTLRYGNDASELKIQKECTILNVENDVIEIDNLPINYLSCSDVMEYSNYEREMDDNPIKSWNYLPTEYTPDMSYYVLTFVNEHNIANNEKFSLNLIKSSPWASNGYVYYNTEQELPSEGKEYTFYQIKYVGDDIEEKNIVKCWNPDAGVYVTLTESEINEKLKDLETGNIFADFYKENEIDINPNKLQIILDSDIPAEWSWDLYSCKMQVLYTINGEDYDDRIFFKECGNKIVLSNNVSATTTSGFLKFNVHINESQGTNLFQETVLKKEYVDDVVNSAIPEINDYEKNIIKPYIQRNENSFERASNIIFNLHFRDRTKNGILTDNWVTDDSKGWNEYDSIDKSDLLYYLGFDKDDVYYQKMKLQKSFLRLSFYDSNNPMNQSLLFYSTIFIDTGDLFGKYNKLKTQAIDGEISGVDSESDVMLIDKDGFERISSQFIVTDRFNTDKSSEGFYLYLFNKTLPKKEPLPIYMKVEFNHAKYGKTIPFLYFTDGKVKTTYVKSENGGKLVDMKSYFRDLHIELNVRYDENTRSYIYYLPYNNTTNGTDIIFNLFEPKING